MVFETEKKAQNFMKFNNQNFDNTEVVPVRAYYCAACGGWHVTKRKTWNKYKEDPAEKLVRAYKNVQRDCIAQQMLGRVIIALPQLHADARRRTHAHGGTEGSAEVHEGEGDREAVDGIGTHHLADAGAVDNIV